MPLRPRPVSLILLLIALLTALPVNSAETDGRAVVFQRRASQPGDTSRQTLNCDLDLNMSIRQSGQIVQQQQQQLQRQQQRELKILKATRDVPQQARVRYHKSVVTLKSPTGEPQSSAQPVTGKTYLVARHGDNLSITYADGGQPTEEEQVIVRQNMETFGLPNPIATFFDGKKVQVGQQLDLPAELARELLGFTATGNPVSQFTLTLSDVRPNASGETSLAVFNIQLQAEDPGQSGVEMSLTGRMVMEVETCRTLSVTLAGPVVASELHGPEGGQYELHSEGQIDVAVHADYVQR